MARVADHDVALRHRLGVGEPFDEAGVGRDVDGRVGLPAVPRREHAHRQIGETGQRGSQQPVLGILGGRRRDEHERQVAVGNLHRLGRRLPLQRPDDVTAGIARDRGYSSWGRVATIERDRLMPPCT